MREADSTRRWPSSPGRELDFVVATIADVQGSSPRDVGTKMLVMRRRLDRRDDRRRRAREAGRRRRARLPRRGGLAQRALRAAGTGRPRPRRPVRRRGHGLLRGARARHVRSSSSAPATLVRRCAGSRHCSTTASSSSIRARTWSPPNASPQADQLICGDPAQTAELFAIDEYDARRHRDPRPPARPGRAALGPRLAGRLDRDDRQRQQGAHRLRPARVRRGWPPSCSTAVHSPDRSRHRRRDAGRAGPLHHGRDRRRQLRQAGSRARGCSAGGRVVAEEALRAVTLAAGQRPRRRRPADGAHQGRRRPRHRGGAAPPAVGVRGGHDRDRAAPPSCAGRWPSPRPCTRVARWSKGSRALRVEDGGRIVRRCSHAGRSR